MSTEFKLPELAEGVESAEITQILVAVGDSIEEEQPVLELETGKATAEIPSSVAGTVDSIAVKEGEEVSIGDVILTVSEAADEEAAEQSKGEESTEEETPVRAQKGEDEETEGKGQGEEKAEGRESERRGAEDRERAAAPSKASGPPESEKVSESSARAGGAAVPAAPSVRKFAREIGIDIGAVPGSGDHGRVFIADVKAFARERNTRGSGKPSTPEAGVPELPDFERWGPVHREKRRMIQRETAKQMTLSWQQIPHVTQFDVADVTGLENVRQRYKEKAEKAGGKLTVTPIVAKVVASALKVFPKFNTSLDTERDQLVYKEYYHLGIAVDTERGLLVPVVRDIDRKNMIELAVEMQELAERTREGKIQADELEGATFTLTNLGGIGGTHFTPIVNWPQVAILGVGRAYKQPRFCGEACESRLLLPLALSYDHRVIDGADGARFLRWIVEALEEPLLLSLEG